VQRIHDRPGRLGFNLNKIDIFGIPGRWLQVQLVERCAAPERERVLKQRIREYIDKGRNFSITHGEAPR
jgi:hypothetical protein